MTIESLNPNMIYSIYSFLGPEDALALRRTCKKLNEAYNKNKDSIEVKFFLKKIQTEFACWPMLRDGCKDNANVKEALEGFLSKGIVKEESSGRPRLQELLPKFRTYLTRDPKNTSTTKEIDTNGIIMKIKMDAKCIYVAAGKVVQIYDKKTKSFNCNLEKHTGSIYSIKLCEKQLFSAGDNGQLFSWNLETKKMLKEFEGHDVDKIIDCLHLDKKYLYSGATDKKIIQWDPKEGTALREFVGHEKSIHGIQTIGNFLISCSLLKDVKVWDLSLEKGHECIQAIEERVHYLKACDDFVAIWTAKKIKFYNLADNKLKNFAEMEKSGYEVEFIKVFANHLFISKVHDENKSSIEVWKMDKKWEKMDELVGKDAEFFMLNDNLSVSIVGAMRTLQIKDYNCDSN